MLDIVTIGHSTLDIFVQVSSARLYCRLQKESCELCFTYADKILADKIEFSVGGNALNTGMGLTRLNVKTGILTYLMSDFAGEKIIQAIQAEGLDASLVKWVKGGQTDQSVILNYQGERTLLAYHHPWIYEWPQHFPDVEWIYLTSINKHFASFHQKLLAYLSEYPYVKLAYNPGSHELKEGLKGNLPILQKSYLLILNKEETIKLLGVESQHEKEGMSLMRELLKSLARLGPRFNIITDGKNGAWAYDGKRFFQQAIFPARRAEMTGAGDAFATGVLAALIRDHDLAEALKWGAALSASVIQKVGGTAGLLTLPQLNEALA